MNNLIEYLRERLGTVIRTCYVILALVLAYSLYVDKGHAHTWVEKNVPFFWSLFGFIAAAIIILVAYWYGHSGIMARKDFYEDNNSRSCSSSTCTNSTEKA